jgi:CheY-like chemotaxis protein
VTRLDDAIRNNRIDRATTRLTPFRKPALIAPKVEGFIVENFGETAKGLARNPLGIIALFIVLVYAMAALVAATGTLTSTERVPIIYFLVAFPVIVLLVFGWLVSRHSEKLYAPSDFRDDKSWLESRTRVVAHLVAASTKPGELGRNESQKIDEAVKAVGHLDRQFAGHRRVLRRSILWVDDRPENNTSLKKAFEDAGIDVSLAESTEQALLVLRQRQFSAIISDMGRREGPDEGYVLLEELRSAGEQTPFFIYAGSASPEHRRMAQERGAQLSTNSATELFTAVTAVI